MFAITEYVWQQIGKVYAEAPPCSMDLLYWDSDKVTPVIFVLSQGADPSMQLINFAKQMNMESKLTYTSLG